MVDPTGISDQEVRKILAEQRAAGEIASIPPARLDPILARLEKDLKERPNIPPRTVTP